MHRWLACTALVAAVCAAPVQAQQIDAEEFVLDNGMKFILYPRTEEPNIIAAGWLAKVGSVNERPGITGISHFFEHMMFKGTNTIGTRDPEKDRELRMKQKAVRDKILQLTLTAQYDRWKNGQIDDPWDPANDTDELAKLRGELNDLMKQHKDIIVKDEFDKVYSELGGSGMNAFTSYDITFYFINVPANKFELWAWMESDRLTDSVFREFYAERDVVHEERRLRTESTPTGIFQEQFDAMFWQASPYAWPVIGWTSDLNSYTKEQAEEYFNIYYRPNNLVGVIVGDFKVEEVKPVIERYFGRLSRGGEVPPVVTLEMKQMAEQRMIAECDCQPQVEVRYKTVPYAHADSYALGVMADILNGRSGRLYKSMIEGEKIASSAQAGSGGFFGAAKYAGSFSFAAETKGDAKPEQLEAAWYRELERLQKEPVTERELQKVKNQSAANSYRRLQSNFFLMVQLGLLENLGRWQYINEDPAKIQAVTAEDIQRVANKYFDKTNRSVGLYYRKAGSETANEDPEFTKLREKLGPQMATAFKKQLEMITKETDSEKLKQAVSQMNAAISAGQVPPNMTDAIRYMATKIEQRLTELEKAAPKN
ncbi:MAG: pitrilysin family protein [Planctomycetota bacterium]|nr:pitrilysin family protein [Planctomycetota bacterium]